MVVSCVCAVNDGSACCECVLFGEASLDEGGSDDNSEQEAVVAGRAPCVDFVPVVGAWVLCRGTLWLDRLFVRSERQLAAAAVRFLSPTTDDITLAFEDRKAMRARYGLS